MAVITLWPALINCQRSDVDPCRAPTTAVAARRERWQPLSAGTDALRHCLHADAHGGDAV